MHSSTDHDSRDNGSLTVPYPDGSTPVFVLREGQNQPKGHLPVSDLLLGQESSLTQSRFLAWILVLTVEHWQMPGVRCPTCRARGIEQWVLPGKKCPRCSTPC